LPVGDGSGDVIRVRSRTCDGGMMRSFARATDRGMRWSRMPSRPTVTGLPIGESKGNEVSTGGEFGMQRSGAAERLLRDGADPADVESRRIAAISAGSMPSGPPTGDPQSTMSLGGAYAECERRCNACLGVSKFDVDIDDRPAVVGGVFLGAMLPDSNCFRCERYEVAGKYELGIEPGDVWGEECVEFDSNATPDGLAGISGLPAAAVIVSGAEGLSISCGRTGARANGLENDGTVRYGCD